jgi:hypothetical protein
MGVRMVFDAHYQYATVQEALGADQWLTTWLQQNGAVVRPAGTFHSAMALIPPTPGQPATDTDPATPDCHGQLTYVIHLEMDTQEESSFLMQEVNKALGSIIAEGGVFDCYGDSGGGGGPE